MVPIRVYREGSMCKIIYDEETVRNLINAFFFPNDSLKSTLKNLCDYNRHGIAYGSDCTLRLSSWYGDDEKSTIDYIGDGNVEIIGWEPYFEEDIKVILSNKQFYEYLKQYAYIYRQNHPTEEGIEDCLNIIKMRLNI